MASTRILRLQRTDLPGQHVLLKASQQSAAKPLNLKLVATQHEHLYHSKIKESSLASLQASNYSGTSDEWACILRHVLLQHESADTSVAETLQGLESVAAINNDLLTVTIRKNIGGITQRLGSISLRQDDEEEEVAPFEWVDIAVAASDELRDRLGTLQVSVNAQQKQIAQLTTQLDELVTAKKAHDDELLRKFAALLNSKKLKIRDQQRLLAGAKIDQNVAEVVDEFRSGGTHSRAADASRSGKRKAGAVTVNDKEGEFVEETNEQEDRQVTPEDSDVEASGSESSTDGFGTAPKAPPASKLVADGDRSRGQTLKSTEEPIGGNFEMQSLDKLPPRRDLPFGKQNRSNARAGTTTDTAMDDAEASEEEETDDEL